MKNRDPRRRENKATGCGGSRSCSDSSSSSLANDKLFILLLLLVFLMGAINVFLHLVCEGESDHSKDINTLRKSHFTNQTSAQMIHPILVLLNNTVYHDPIIKDHNTINVIDTEGGKDVPPKSPITIPNKNRNHASNNKTHAGVKPDDESNNNDHNAINNIDVKGEKDSPLEPPITIPKSNQNNDDRDDSNGKARVRQILQRAGIKITPDIESVIPTWSEVTSLYGSEPRIMGLETCATFRKSVPVAKAMIGPSGTFNTGTNLLANLLNKQCTFPRRLKGSKVARGMLYQVPWGKHNPIALRLKHHTAPQGDIIQSNVLPIVMIKDPYHWMGSMCRHPYVAKWRHSKQHCPNLISNKDDVQQARNEGEKIGVTVLYTSQTTKKYESLVGLWSGWYGDYVAVDSFPRLIIRFEDLLFHLEEVMTKVCECAGGTVKEDIALVDKSAKGEYGPHTGGSGLLSAIKRYGHEERRVEGMTENDLDYAKRALREDMMKTFGYSYPEQGR